MKLLYPLFKGKNVSGYFDDLEGFNSYRINEKENIDYRIGSCIYKKWWIILLKGM